MFSPKYDREPLCLRFQRIVCSVVDVDVLPLSLASFQTPVQPMQYVLLSDVPISLYADNPHSNSTFIKHVYDITALYLSFQVSSTSSYTDIDISRSDGKPPALAAKCRHRIGMFWDESLPLAGV